MTARVRVGVVGTGIGVTHVEVLRQVPGAEVAAVCSAQTSRADAVATRFDIPLATDEYRDLLGAGLDAVVIATPPALHESMAARAIDAGLHVLCEKPLAATLEEARRMRDAARAAGIIHVIGHQMRFATPFMEARRLADEGYLGRLVVADSRFVLNPVDYLRAPVASDSKAGWYTDVAQAGGLLTAAAGPHQVDLLRWFGGPIEAVAAQVAVSRPAIELADGTMAGGITAEDAYLVLVRFVSGGIATMRGVPVAYHTAEMQLDLHGSGGSLEISFDALRGASSADHDLSDLPLPGDVLSGRVSLMARFVEAIRTGDPALAATLPSFDDGVGIQAVLAACLEAARSGEWVQVERD